MVSVLASSAVDRGFEPRSGQTKDYKFGICCFPTKHTALRSKSQETTHTNFIVFGLTWPGLEPTIYHTRGEHVNYYTTDAVKFYYRDQIKYLIIMCINNIAFLTEFLVCILERKSHEYTIPTAHSTTLWVIIYIITTYHQKRNEENEIMSKGATSVNCLTSHL